MAKPRPKKRTAPARSKPAVARKSGPLKARKPRRAIDKVYASLLANMPGEVYRCRNDRDWTMEYVSEGVLDLTGYAPDDFLSGLVKFGDLMHPEDVGRVREACEAALARREPYTLEYRIRTRNGVEKWVWERGCGVFGRNGAVVRLEGFVGDVTERKRSEEALRAQTERMSLGQSTAGMLLLEWDATNDLLSWSTSPDWLRGPLPAGGEYPLFKDQVHPEDRAEFLRVRRLGMEKPRRDSHEYRIVRTDGKVLWILSQRVSLAGPDGRVNRMLVAIHDITRRKEAELALAQSEARFRDFAQSSGDWFWETDADNRYTWFSGQLEENVGRPPSFYLGRDRFEVAIAAGADLDAEPWKSHVSAIGRREPFRNFVHHRVTPSGQYWLSLSGLPRFDGGGFLGYRGAVTNITAQVQAEARARDADARLGAALDGLDESIAVTDADDRIVVTNRYFRALNGNTHLVDPGCLYEEHLRAGVALGNYPGALGREEEWLRERLAARRRGGTLEVPRQDGRWLQVTDQRLPGGGVVTFGLDITGRKRAEQVLAESEARFRDFASASGEWFWETDAEHRYTWFSEEVEHATGFPREWHYGKSRFDLMQSGGADFSQEPWRSHAAAVERRDAFRDFRFARLAPDGERWISSSGVPFFSPGGAFLGYRGVGFDVTNEVDLERKAREADARLRAAIENMGESITLTDAEDRIIIANRAFRELNRYDEAFIASRPSFEAHLRRALASGVVVGAAGREEAWLAERMAQRGRGSVHEVGRADGRWLQVTEQRLPDGGVITIALDISARRNAEEALRASEQRFRALVEMSSDWYWQTDARHRFTLRVGDVLDSMGLPWAADLGKRRDEVGFLNMQRADWAEHYAMLDRREEFRDLLLERRGPAGRIFWATISGRPLYDRAGAFAGYHGIGRDITAQVEAERALHNLNVELEVRVAQRTAELKTAYQELESFSYSVSHDLRAPLRAISGFAGILREDEGGKLSEAGLRHLSTIDASAQQMGKLVDALLELVRMSRHAIVGSRIDMAQVAREVVEILSLEHPRARIEVQAMPDANGDATLVRQVYANLIGNALKYSASEAAPQVIVGAESNGTATVYFVRDNGVGFDMRYSGKLFKPFERLHTDPGFKGTGIGLALASLIVHRHGGRIEADSAPGDGATFRFTLGGA